MNAVDDDEKTALHYVAENGRVDLMNVLIQNGADVSAVTENKWTALHRAARYGHVDVTKVLLRNGADVNAVTKDISTALHFTSRFGHLDVAKALIQNGADVNAIDKDKRTALGLVAMCGNIPYTLQLTCFGARIDYKTIKEDKTTLLIYIENRLQLLRHGCRLGTSSLMSDEERHFMWNLEFVLAVKHPAIAFKTYHMIRAFVTFHGDFMGPGYDLGQRSIWRKEIKDDEGW